VSGSHWRGFIEADIRGFKRVITGALCSHTDGRCATEIAVAVSVLNHPMELGSPEHVRTA
jgi:hypothetical protein